MDELPDGVVTDDRVVVDPLFAVDSVRTVEVGISTSSVGAMTDESTTFDELLQLTNKAAAKTNKPTRLHHIGNPLSLPARFNYTRHGTHPQPTPAYLRSATHNRHYVRSS